MNCREVSKYLYAFADGELETRENLTVLEHVNVCPACCRKVAVQQKLKSALKHAAGDLVVPATMRARLSQALDAEIAVEMEAFLPHSASIEPGREVASEPMARSSGGQRASSESRRRAIPMWRYLVPAAAAAAAVLVLLTYNPLRSNTGSTTVAGGAVPVYAVTDSSEAAMELADAIVRVHEENIREWKVHPDPQFPQEPLDAAKLIGRRLGGPMLYCNKLAKRDGIYECGGTFQLTMPGGEDRLAGQLVFRLRNGPIISLISVKALDQMVGLQKTRVQSLARHTPAFREYAILRPHSSNNPHPFTVVGFDCPQCTHFVCGPVEPEEAVRMTQQAEPLMPSLATAPPAKQPFAAVSSR